MEHSFPPSHTKYTYFFESTAIAFKKIRLVAACLFVCLSSFSVDLISMSLVLSLSLYYCCYDIIIAAAFAVVDISLR